MPNWTPLWSHRPGRWTVPTKDAEFYLVCVHTYACAVNITIIIMVYNEVIIISAQIHEQDKINMHACRYMCNYWTCRYTVPLWIYMLLSNGHYKYNNVMPSSLCVACKLLKPWFLWHWWLARTELAFRPGMRTPTSVANVCIPTRVISASRPSWVVKQSGASGAPCCAC